MIKENKTISTKRKCELMDIKRSSLYYIPKSIPEEEFELRRQLDEIHLKYPFLGSRRIGDPLEGWEEPINRKRFQRLMREMGITAVYPKPRTTYRNMEHKIYPYLLRNMVIDKPNQVWATDITYIPMEKGWLYLVAIMDWNSRKELSWRLSNSLDSEFCIEALEEAIAKYGKPEIFNTDQGSQFTSEEFTKILMKAEIKISMDGKGRWMDNVFVERLWRSLKYEEVYLKAYETVEEAREGIGSWMEYYNSKRKHQSLGKRTPDQVYYKLKQAA